MIDSFSPQSQQGAAHIYFFDPRYRRGHCPSFELTSIGSGGTFGLETNPWSTDRAGGAVSQRASFARGVWVEKARLAVSSCRAQKGPLIAGFGGARL